MPQVIESLAEVATVFEAIVLDQFGVLHDGTHPYPRAIAATKALRETSTALAILSNSGKRARVNADRIAAMGFDLALFETVMTSGEALWRDIAGGTVSTKTVYPIERDPGDAALWAQGLDITLTHDVSEAEAVLLMGLPDHADRATLDRCLALARAQGKPVFCTNPDRASPRADGSTVLSPGALAHEYLAEGGTVRFYGKPHGPVFKAVESALRCTPEKVLMVGDSLEHDIAGAKAAGWATAFVLNGLHAAAFAGSDDHVTDLAHLARAEGTPLPDYILRELS